MVILRVCGCETGGLMIVSGTKVGKIIALAYLVIVFVSTIPLLKDLAIHHGNGIAFLAATVLTSPFSWLFLWIIDKTLNPNAFHMTGWLFGLEMLVITFCAFVNAKMILSLSTAIKGTPRG